MNTARRFRVLSSIATAALALTVAVGLASADNRRADNDQRDRVACAHDGAAKGAKHAKHDKRDAKHDKRDAKADAREAKRDLRGARADLREAKRDLRDAKRDQGDVRDGRRDSDRRAARTGTKPMRPRAMVPAPTGPQK